MHLQAQLLRDAFHGTLSHELCSPLAAIQGSASVLNSMPAIRGDRRVHSLVEAISDEVAELDGFIQNLLNATRVTASGVSPRLEWADPRDIVNAAIRQTRAPIVRSQGRDRIRRGFAAGQRGFRPYRGSAVDSFWRMRPNTPRPARPISISTRAERGRVILSVSDQGVGITPDEQQQLGRRSFRSQRHQATIPGIRPGILDRVDLRQGERRQHRHFEPRARARCDSLDCPARISHRGPLTIEQ